MHAPPTRCTSTISNGYTNPPEISGKARGLYPRPPCDCREVFSCGGVLPRRAAVQHGRSAHSPRAGASCAEKDKKKVRTGSPDRVFVMKNRTFVEFISKIRAACLFLHIANKKLIPMRIKFRTSRPMQTPRDISYTGNPTGGTTAYPARTPGSARGNPRIPTTSFTERSGLL